MQLKCKEKKIRAVYGKGAMTDWMYQKCFAKLHAGEFSLEDAPRSSGPLDDDGDQTETLTKNNRRYTTQKVTDIFKISQSIKFLAGENSTTEPPMHSIKLLVKMENDFLANEIEFWVGSAF